MAEETTSANDARDLASRPPSAPPTEIPSDAPHRELALDAEGRIAENVHCRGCAYNLRGLRPDGMCPECETSVEVSVRGDLLRFADPDWLERLSHGAWTILAGYIVMTVVGIFGGFASVLLMTSGPQAFSLAIGIVMVLSIGVSLVALLGVWWVTTPEPSMIDRENGLTARLVARYGAMAMLINAPSQFLMQSSSMTMMPTGAGGGGAPAAGALAFMTSPVWYSAMGISTVANLIATAGAVAGLLYLSRLARRVPNPSLAKQCRVVMWGYGLTMGFAVIFGIVFVFTTPTTLTGVAGGGGAGGGGTPGFASTAGFIAMGVVGCGIALGSAVFGVWALVLMGVFGGVFRKAARQSREGLAILGPPGSFGVGTASAEADLGPA